MYLSKNQTSVQKNFNFASILKISKQYVKNVNGSIKRASKKDELGTNLL
jgi:hypothetical protein